MTNPNLDIWTSVLADLPPFVYQQMGKSIDFNNPPPFFDFALSTLERYAAIGADSAASIALLENNLVVRAVCNPGLFTAADAIRLAAAAMRLDVTLDAKILQRLTGPPRM